jgi:hypothetical protein
VTVALRKLSREEAVRAFPRRGQIDVSEYVAALQTLQVGDSAEIELGELTSRAAKRRLGQAAQQVGYRLKWAPATFDDRLYFQVLPTIVRSAGRPENGRRSRPRAAQLETPITISATPPTATPAMTPPRARRRRPAVAK